MACRKGAKMRIRTSVCLLICCCAGLAACTAAAPKGPHTAVRTPSVGRPPPPASVQAALSRDPFTPYAALGQSNNDGLAPGESDFNFSQACMTAAGYPNAGSALLSIRLGAGGLAFSQPWGQWGYLGLAEAEQYGFLVPPGSALTSLGIDFPPPGSNPASLPAAEQTAIGKCATITGDFDNQLQSGPLAGIQTLGNDIYNDILRDAAVKNATTAWSACMAKNGYSYRQPQDVFFEQMHAIYGGSGHGIQITNTPPSTAARQAQTAAAVTDATCTQSTDLAGIYFAVQASYEQQLVNANQQALNVAVRQYRAAYQKQLTRLPALLRAAKAQPFRTHPKVRSAS
jgi:hypothetical protein